MKNKPIVLIALLATLLSACNRSDDLPVGQEVITQFDRSALGSAANLPVSPTTESINGANTAIRGKLLHADSEWIHIEKIQVQQGGELTQSFWIPRNKVLLIESEIYLSK